MRKLNLLLITALMFILISSIFVSAERTKVYGNSMSPTIQDRDTIYIDRRPKDIRLNDIILFPSWIKQAGNVEYFTLHRIVGVTKTHYITKGDNNPYTNTELVKKEDVIGKFIRVIK